MDKYVIAPPSGSTNNSVGAADRPWKEGHFDSIKLNGGDLGEYLAESTGYGIVSGCTPTISGLTVTVASGVVHLADGTRKEIAATSITLDAADSTNPRIDLLYIDSAGEVAKVTGTAASPSAPSVPSGGISICVVTVAANANTGSIKIQTQFAQIDFDKVSTYYPSKTDAFVDLINNDCVIKNAKFTLDRDVTLTKVNCVLVNSEIDLNTHKLWIDAPVLTSDNILSNTTNTVTIADASGYSAGDFVKLTSSTYLWLCYRTTVESVSGNVITLSENIPIAGVFGTIIKLPKNNIIVSNTSLLNGVFMLLEHVNGALISHCSFKNTDVSVNGANITVDCCADMLSLALYSASHCVISDCEMKKSYGIRGVAISNCVIENNRVLDGASKQHSFGIEINGCDNGAGFVVNDTTNVSGINNKIINNTVINANKGVAGSAIGGIHLNWSAHDNLIDGNTCNENGIGIYLENNACNNIISNNTCNYNNDYYGVGIELDWDCNYNIISNNICNYNAGSVTADESCGIEIRGSRSSSHVCQFNKIINNICKNNGRCGIIDDGIASIISGNHITENGSDVGYSSRGQILIYGANNTNVSNNFVMGKNPLLGYTDSTYLPSNMVISCNEFFGDDTGDDIIFDALMTSSITNNIVNKGITINSNSGNRNITIINNFSQNYGAIKIEGVNGYKCLYNYKNDGAMAVVATGSTEYA